MLVNKYFYCCIVVRGIYSFVVWVFSLGYRKEKDFLLIKSDFVRFIVSIKKLVIYI